MQTQTNNQGPTIALVGGGSGGHITPLLAVATELKQLQPACRLIYIGEKGGKFFDMTANSQLFAQSYAVRAGKFRRYQGQSWLRRLFALKTNFLNIRDAFYVLLGLSQSKKLLKNIRPDMVFIKGGFVGVPVGKACIKLKIPYITHDSDTLPGLANRMIAKGALWHAVGMPKEFYSYPQERTVVTGTPVRAEFRPVTAQLQTEYRDQLRLPAGSQVVFVSGGSLGAQRLNFYIQEIAESLLRGNPNLVLIHQVGQGNKGIYVQLSQKLQQRLLVLEYADNLHVYSGAADVVVTRAGATTIAELAVQQKPTILVPNPLLTGGHQSINAELLAKKDAVKIVTEDVLNKDPGVLKIAIEALLADGDERRKMAEKIHEFGYPNAADRIAALLLSSLETLKTQGKKE